MTTNLSSLNRREGSLRNGRPQGCRLCISGVARLNVFALPNASLCEPSQKSGHISIFDTLHYMNHLHCTKCLDHAILRPQMFRTRISSLYLFLIWITFYQHRILPRDVSNLKQCWHAQNDLGRLEIRVLCSEAPQGSNKYILVVMRSDLMNITVVPTITTVIGIIGTLMTQTIY